MNGKAYQKGRYKVKVGKHLNTNMLSKPVIVRRGEHKCRLLEMHLKLKDQQLKRIFFIYRLLYQYIMVTANQKSTMDTHTHSQKEKKEKKKNISLLPKSTTSILG